jgi:hypothetical protein
MVQKYGPKQFDQTMEFNGGANNAYTTENVTVYTVGFLPQLLLYLISKRIAFRAWVLILALLKAKEVLY